jgi:hypothetical protein
MGKLKFGGGLGQPVFELKAVVDAPRSGDKPPERSRERGSGTSKETMGRSIRIHSQVSEPWVASPVS